MMQYIPKAALIAEIERRKEEDEENYQKYGDPYDSVLRDEMENILSFLGTLETKGVDLEKEFNVFLDLVEGVPRMWHSDEQIKWAKDIARHFFELGLFSQLTWQDIRLIAEIGEDFMNSDGSDNLSDEEYYTAILNKLKNEGMDCKTSRQWIRDISNTQKGE